MKCDCFGGTMSNTGAVGHVTFSVTSIDLISMSVCIVREGSKGICTAM